MIRYQVQGWKYREIADEYCETGHILTEDMIGKGIKKAARFIGLKLRPARKGRRMCKAKNPN